ncbi:hypothetical protein FRC02_009120 [Tulasnella sp. 418]|nr:hypothetical protein FRC02_009120 [Tulasnella sp. 418]
MSDPEDSPYDYTEGASAVEITQVLSSQRRRRDSQMGSAYDDDGSGAVFGGPGASVVPSSVTTMHHERPLARRKSSDGRSRRSMSRRDSGESDRSRSRRRSSENEPVEVDSDVLSDGFEDEDENEMSRSYLSRGSRSRKRRARQTSPPESPKAQRSVFDNIANFFGGGAEQPTRAPGSRRTSVSSRRRRSGSRAGSERGEDEVSSGEERWGYASGEEDESDGSEFRGRDLNRDLSDEYHSGPPSPSASLPLITGHGDPFFGDTRIDMEELERSPSPPPPPGPASRQSVFLADEDIHLRFIGYEPIAWRQWMWFTGSIASLGTLALTGYWAPNIWLRWVAQEKSFKLMKEGLVVVETSYRTLTIEKMRVVDYPYPLSTAFTSSIPSSSSTPIPRSSTPIQSQNDRMSLGSGNGQLFANGTTGVPGPSPLLSFIKMMDYRYTRYILDPRTGLFSMLKDWRDPSWTSVTAIRQGPDKSTRDQRQILFGSNVIDIEGKSVITLLVEEVLHPFYVFQIASIILWSIDDYYYYAFCIALISGMSIGTTLIETKKTIERMREMSRFSCPVGVLIDNEWTTVDSSELVPGDIVDLLSPSLSVFPADMLLLSGDAIVNESMLTGESVPVSKVPIRDEHLLRWRDSGEVDGDIAKGFLYSGTKVVRIRGDTPPDGVPQALAIVVRTGFNTTKGALVRSMLYPKPMGFKFYRDSMRFISFLAGLAGLGFLASAVQFVKLGVKWHTIFIRALDLITVVVPPALPATLSIGTSFAISRLRKSGIFCISPNRVNVGGKINVVCFDKTGTLTEDGLDVLGVRTLDRSNDLFGELIDEVHDLPLGSGKATFLYALATCHSLKKVDGEIIGDPLDAKMFEFTRWTLEEGQTGGVPLPKKGEHSRIGDRPTALVQTIVRPPGSVGFRLEDALKSGSRHAHFLELGVIRTFEFVSALRRMSVIVKRLKSASMEVYVKGAPEVMGEICVKESFPKNYDDLLAYYTKHGYRVIAIAGKSIEGLSWLKAQRMKREQAESNLRFLGLIIFENKLKPGTTPAIQTLRSAHFACRMVTGDNPRTAVSVARECGMVSLSAHVFYPVFIEGNAQTARSKLEWSSVDDESLKLDDYSLKPLALPVEHVADSIDALYQDYALVVTGDVFRWMVNHAPLETLQRMLVKAQVFARMSPDEKHELVERLQSLGYTVAFCGDDLFIIIPIAVFMGRTHAFPRLHTSSPTASLVSKKVLSSIIGQVLITSGAQFWAFFWVRRQPWYTPPDPDSGSDKLETINYENTVLFLISSYQYILVAAVFSIGPPYRQPIWTNVLLMLSIVILTLFSTVVLISPPQSLAVLLDLMNIPFEGKITLLIAAAASNLLATLAERWAIVEKIVTFTWHLSSDVLGIGKGKKGRRIRDGKTYKAVEGAMR